MSFTIVNYPLINQPLEFIQNVAWNLGFDRCVLVSPQIPFQDQVAYENWVKAGMAGEMQYLTRDPSARLNLSRKYSFAKSVLSVGVSYYQGPVPEKPGTGYGRVARYAWGEDYHDIIEFRLTELINKIKKEFSVKEALVAVDSKPLFERALARKGGMGFIGKNTVLILPQNNALFPRHGFHVGSWVFIAEILLDIELGNSVENLNQQAGCGGCTKCLTACPTQAFDGAYKLDSRKCISYLTIENKGAIPIEMRKHLKDWIYGCDICQDVCPFNAQAFETRWPELKANRGVGAWLSLTQVLSIRTQSEYKEKFKGTPLLRAKRKGLLRNACVVAGNSQDEALIPILELCLKDEEPLIREHALWAIEQLKK
ncbi:MAG: tRNA epoxyqueuosine(34) reductase QueG [Elusimicrobiota bacterium]